MNDTGDMFLFPLNLLLFSVCGVHFGVDADQVAGIAAYNGEESDDLFWFHEELNYGAAGGPYFSPTVITIRIIDGQSYRVIIDSMEDITGFSQNEISLFPALLEPFAAQRGLWGILPRNGSMVFLLDFQRLFAEKRQVND